MHILATTSASIDDLIEPVDLRQQPADMVALSFADSDLVALSRAWRDCPGLPTIRLAALRDLRHPMSVDLWVDSVARHARVILVRLLGGYDWWSYGCDRLSDLARKQGIALALLPGESHAFDERLQQRSTLRPDELADILAYFREGGPENMNRLLRRLAGHAGAEPDASPPAPLAKAGYYTPRHGLTPKGPAPAIRERKRNAVLVLFYRSMLLADDVAPIDSLCDALARRGIDPVPIFVPSLKDPEAATFVEYAAREWSPSAIITTTAFASGNDRPGGGIFDRMGIPVFQALIATTRRDSWAESQRGLAPADLAMHVVLPELDGRILAGSLSFKAPAPDPDAMGQNLHLNEAEPDRVEAVVQRVAAYLALRDTPRADRRLAILMPDYPGATGRTGYAVGLDVPASVIAMLHDLKAAGYHVDDIPDEPRDLVAALSRARTACLGPDYFARFSAMPAMARESVLRAWGEPERHDFHFRACQFGNVTVAVAPDRGMTESRRADYHDAALPPGHALLAFGFWLRHEMHCHALIHVGAHGTLEWLPGKAVALSRNCFPEIVAGALPVIYPFIVSNPGEAAQAKRRIGAVTIGHLSPPLTAGGSGEDLTRLERLVDEYAQADGLDRKRRDLLARSIVKTAVETGLAEEAGVSESDDTDDALIRIDAWLCDLKDLAIKDGLHVFGRAAAGEDDPARVASAAAERAALLDALDGGRIPPGPAGAPARGRTDVLPTGRNLFAADPRTMPTPTAFDLGKAAAGAVLRRHLQEHGDWPRSLVIDLWGSASLRTGGEEIAQGLAMMGCRPIWDAATGRVTGIEVLPAAMIEHPRIDVSWRISGLFRDMFSTQIALIDAAVAAVTARDEPDDVNPLAAERRRTGTAPARVFGGAPGVYGTGIETLLQTDDWQDREELGRAYLEGASHVFGGPEGAGRHAPDAFAERLRAAELLVHTGDDPGRDLLEGSADVAFIGGFSAAVSALGGKADIVALDTTNPSRPRVRSLAEALTRIVRARATNRTFIDGQMRHGPRGAAEFAETVDRLVGFAETTDAVPGTLIEAVYDAYLGDPRVRQFLLRENPPAARAIAERFEAARRRGLWHPKRNSVDADLTALLAEASFAEGAP